MSKMFCEGCDPNSKLFSTYENFSQLSTDELQYALRIVQRELEKKLNLSLTDDEFMELFQCIKREHLLHPLGPWSGVTLSKVYNGPFCERARLNNDEKVLNAMKKHGCWYIASGASVCHRFFRESFSNF